MTYAASEEAADAPDERYVALVEALLAHWASLAARVEDSSGRQKDPVRSRAYVLFNRWEANPLAESMTAQFPKWPRDRVTVPDSYFEHRPERAPCLLELPEELAVPMAGAQTKALREWL